MTTRFSDIKIALPKVIGFILATLGLAFGAGVAYQKFQRQETDIENNRTYTESVEETAEEYTKLVEERLQKKIDIINEHEKRIQGLEKADAVFQTEIKYLHKED